MIPGTSGDVSRHHMGLKAAFMGFANAQVSFRGNPADVSRDVREVLGGFMGSTVSFRGVRDALQSVTKSFKAFHEV